MWSLVLKRGGIRLPLVPLPRFSRSVSSSAKVVPHPDPQPPSRPGSRPTAEPTDEPTTSSFTALPYLQTPHPLPPTHKIPLSAPAIFLKPQSKRSKASKRSPKKWRDTLTAYSGWILVPESIRAMVDKCASPIDATTILADNGEVEPANRIIQYCPNVDGIEKAYEALIKAQIRRNSPRKAATLLHKLRRCGRPPTADTIAIIVEKAILHAELKLAEILVYDHIADYRARRRALSLSGHTPSISIPAEPLRVAVSTIHSLIDRFAEAGLSMKADQTLLALEKTRAWTRPTRIIPAQIIAHQHANLHDEAWNLYRTAVRDGYVPTVEFISSLTRDHAKALSLIFRYGGHVSRALAHAALISVIRTGAPMKDIFAVLSVMRDVRIEPESDTYQVWMVEYARCGYAIGAEALMAAAKADGIERDQHLWATYTDAIRKGGGGIEAIRAIMWAMRKEDGLIPSSHVYNIAFEECAIAGNGRFALQLYEEVCSLRIPIISKSYLSIIMALLGEHTGTGIPSEVWRIYDSFIDHFTKNHLPSEPTSTFGEVYLSLILTLLDTPLAPGSSPAIPSTPTVIAATNSSTTAMTSTTASDVADSATDDPSGDSSSYSPTPTATPKKVITDALRILHDAKTINDAIGTKNIRVGFLAGHIAQYMLLHTGPRSVLDLWDQALESRFDRSALIMGAAIEAYLLEGQVSSAYAIWFRADRDSHLPIPTPTKVLLIEALVRSGAIEHACHVFTRSDQITSRLVSKRFIGSIHGYIRNQGLPLPIPDLKG